MMSMERTDKCESAGRPAAGKQADASALANRRDVLISALRVAPVVLLLTARGAQAAGSAASGAPSGG
jgi:hypothetical protein